VTRRATYDDVLNAPENKVAEILDGELFLSPRPRLRHAMAQGALQAAIHTGFGSRGAHGGWQILLEPELHFGEQVLVPDLSGWRRERMPTVPDEAWTALPPDWVCEVLSPSTARIDRGRKLRIYAEAGVTHAWLVSPNERTLEVLRLHEGSWMIVHVFSGSESVRAEPFEAVALELSSLWPEPEDAPPTSA
jgi:Uma2 family endonuclease